MTLQRECQLFDTPADTTMKLIFAYFTNEIFYYMIKLLLRTQEGCCQYILKSTTDNIINIIGKIGFHILKKC